MIMSVRSDNLSYNSSTWMSLFCFIFIYFFGVCVFFLSFFCFDDLFVDGCALMFVLLLLLLSLFCFLFAFICWLVSFLS